MSERPVVFNCDGSELVGVLNVPAQHERLGVLIVVGGPQYRVGSHRQFVALARALAGAGFACLRFDYRGMGDSDGGARTFEAVDQDVRAALDALLAAAPDLDGVVLWGLCDGASAALIYAPQDERVHGVVALNPWVRTEASLAAARVNHYYKGKLFSAQFWRRLLSGEVAIGAAVTDFLRTLAKRLYVSERPASKECRTSGDFISRMSTGWEKMRDKALVILSGNDLTAQEFVDFCRARPVWSGAVQPGPNMFQLADADHTFSRREWKHSVEQVTVDWLRHRLASLDSVNQQRSA